MRGFKIICKLSKWDKDNKINYIIDSLLQVLDDEKPTIIRQCLASLNNLMLYKIDSLEKAKNAPCIFNNWANFYKGEFVSNTILNANSFKNLID